MTITRTTLTVTGTVLLAGALALGGSVSANAASSPVLTSAATSTGGAATGWTDLPTGEVLATQHASDVRAWLVRSDADGLVYVNAVELGTGRPGSVLLDLEDYPQPGADGVEALVAFGVGADLQSGLFAGTVGEDVREVTVHTDSGDVAADVVEGHWIAAWTGHELSDDDHGSIPATVTLQDGSSYSTLL